MIPDAQVLLPLAAFVNTVVLNAILLAAIAADAEMFAFVILPLQRA